MRLPDSVNKIIYPQHHCCVCGRGIRKPQYYKSYRRLWDGMDFRWGEIACLKHSDLPPSSLPPAAG